MYEFPRHRRHIIIFPLESKSATKSDAGITAGRPERLNERIGLSSPEVSPRVYVNVALEPLKITLVIGESVPLPLVKDGLMV